jgi:hypothetical protein
MPVIARDFDDTILDIIVAGLRAFETAQAAIDSKDAFFCDREMLRPIPASKLPFVNVYVPTITPDPTQSGTLITCYEALTVNFDLIVRGIEKPTATGVDPIASDQVATRQLSRLKGLVRYWAYALVNATFGLADPNPIRSKKWPRYTMNPERALSLESQIVDGQLAMDIEYEWTPADLQVIRLTDLYATLVNPGHYAPEPGVHEHFGT